jgi:hypothetical protein
MDNRIAHEIRVRTIHFPDEVVAEVRMYTKKELCELYGISKNTLAAWINRSLHKFEAIGYNKYQKLFTKAQVRLCFELWGEP